MAGTRKRLLAGMGALAVTLGGASFAWACSGQATVVFGSASGTASGPAGSTARVSGAQWDSEPVHIRWNSPAGQELGAPRGPSFSNFAIEIPTSASPGVHTVYFVQYERDAATGTVNGEAAVGSARLAFEVTPAGTGDVRYSAPADNNPATRTSSSTSGADETSGSSGGVVYSTSSGTSGGDAPAGASAPSDKSFGSLAPATGNAAPAALDAGSSAPAANRSASASAGASPAAQTSNAAQPNAAATEGQPVFGGSVASSSPALAPGAPADEAQASARSATGDVWAGFESGNASLVPGLGDTATGTSGSAPSLAIGVGLLSAGIGMLFAGFGVAEVRRQRAVAHRQG